MSLKLLRILIFGLPCFTTVADAAKPADPLSAWLAKHGEIRVAPAPDLAPIDGIDATGQHRGLAADYLKRIAQHSGLRFRIVPVADGAQAIKAFREGRADMLSAAFASPARADERLLSAPYLRLPCAVYAPTDGGDVKSHRLDGRSVAVAAGHPCAEQLVVIAPKAEVHTFDGITAAVNALAQGKTDALVGDLVATSSAIAKLGQKDRLIISDQLDGDGTALSFAIRRDWPELKQLLDVALAGIDVDEERALRRRWLGDLLPTTPQAITTHTPVPMPESHLDAIRAAITTLPNLPSLNESTREQASDVLATALIDEQQADQLMGEWRDLRSATARAEKDTAALEQSFSQDNNTAMLAWRASLPERASVEQLENLLATERAALADARSATAAQQTELTSLFDRPGRLREELKAAQTALDKTRDTASSATDAPSRFDDAVRLRQLAAQRLGHMRVMKLEEELRSYEPRLRYTTARLRENQRQVAEREQKVELLQNRVLDRTSASVAELNARLHKERETLGPQSHPLARAADANIVLGDELARDVVRLGEVRELRNRYGEAQNETTQALKNTQDRLEIGGVTEAVGLMLLAERRKLQPLAVLKRQRAALETELAQARIRLIDLRELSTSLEDVGDEVHNEFKRLPEGTSAAAALRSGLYQILNTRAELVPRLIAAQTRLADALADSVQALHSLTDSTAKLGDLLDRTLLWRPSHAPVSLTWFSEVADGMMEFLQPRRWWRSFELAAKTVIERPVAGFMTLAVLMLLIVLRLRVPAKLEEISIPMRRIRSDRYRLTGHALLLTLIAALPLPYAIWIFARLWQRAAAPGYAFADAIGLALADLIPIAATLAFLSVLNLDKGLAHFHFRWTQARRQALTLLRRSLIAAVLPVQFVLAVQFYHNDDRAMAGFGRALFVLVSMMLTAILWRVFGPGALWTHRSAVREPNRLRQLSRVGLTGFTLILALLTLAGYYLTAVTLAASLIESGIVVLVVGVLHALALRWLAIGERRLALKRLDDRKEGEATREDDRIETRPDLIENEEITLASINVQTRRLLRALTAVTLVALLLWVWADVMPALSYLGEHVMWTSSYAADGKEMVVQITLRLALLALVVLGLTWIATRNLPGLLEIGVLRRLEVDAPTRYAITAICRYAIAIVGTTLGLSLLGLRWSQLQWMAAALTVGLGFGLQEIFANFVSGLIVLFERPMRVGDTISIRDIEGTVARIRTRATTVIDWDNREVVIPNKTFITEQLTNWTLSDAVTRIVLKLGFGYRSNPEQIRTLLLDLARVHPKVLREPAPTCWFVALGSSSLDFDLRVFVADVADRNPVRNELLIAILRECNARDIEIPFPQTDIWLRNTSEITATLDKKT